MLAFTGVPSAQKPRILGVSAPDIEAAWALTRKAIHDPG